MGDQPPDHSTHQEDVHQTKALFKEADEAAQLAKDLPTHKAAAARKLCAILDAYQEQPTLLDHALETLVPPVLDQMRAVATAGPEDADADGSAQLALPPAARVFYTLCKVRGFKTIVKFVSHEARDLEPLVRLLAAYPPDHPEWHVAYALMVWLSMVVMVPFDLSIIDSALPAGATTSAAGEPAPLVRSIEELARAHLSCAGPSRDAAAVLLARLLTRPGLQHQLRGFIVWGAARLGEARAEGGVDGRATFLTAGICAALAAVFKLGHREELLPQLAALDAFVANPRALLGDPSVTRRKLGTKLLQRVALVHLPPRLAAWRYTRGARSLAHNLGGGDPSPTTLAGFDGEGVSTAAGGASPAAATAAASVAADAADGAAAAANDDDGLVPEALEGILEQLLEGLRDADTVVRWSAAKGVGRITGRLPLELADDVVGSCLELLDATEPANAWHGGCLALAELARRGLLLPARLADSVPRVIAALRYDVPRGAHSVGTHVRDAACYVSWAFARAFDAATMAPHVHGLAQSLLVLVAFDREVNVRRAASAAFQENVGRQGSFPHGIDIVTRTDYFAVSVRANAYLKLATFLAGYDEYRQPLLEHLLHSKSRHWDEAVRQLAARSARLIAPMAREWAEGVLLPELCKRTLSPDLKERHGSALMLAEVALGLCGGADATPHTLPAELRKQLSGVVPAVEKARLYRGRGGEVMRGASCRVLEANATIRLPCGPKAALRTLASIDESIKHPSEAISLAAVGALRAVTEAYYAQPRERTSGGDADGAAPEPPGPPLADGEPLVARYAKPLLADPNAGLRRGYALAIGALPAAQLRLDLPRAVEALIEASTLEADAERHDPETRRNALASLPVIASAVGLAAHGGGMPTALYVRAVEGAIRALGDYQTDNRGDVGSWVNEKIDRVRELAASTLVALLASALPRPAHHHELRAIFRSGDAADGTTDCFLRPHSCFLLTARLLALHAYRRDALRGIVTSAGGMSESTLRAADAAMRSVIGTMHAAGRLAIADDLLALLEEECEADGPRLALPLLKTACQLIESNLLERLRVSLGKSEEAEETDSEGEDGKTGEGELGEDESGDEGDEEEEEVEEEDTRPYVERLHEAVRALQKKAKGVSTIVASMTLQVLLLPHATKTLLPEAFRAVVLLLGHRYPKVRKAAADHLYVHLITHGEPKLGTDDAGDGRLDDCVTVLLETPWLGGLDEHARPARARLLELYALPPPLVAACVVGGGGDSTKPVDVDSYAELVGEAGY